MPITIYHNLKLLEVHDRITDTNQTRSTKSHHLKPWERTIEDGAMYRQRALRLGQHVAEMVDRILKQGQGFIDTRKIWGILSLDKRYSAERIDKACERAIDMDSFGYRVVVKLLEIENVMAPNQDVQLLCVGTKKDERNPGQLPNKFVRSLSVYEAQLSLEGSSNDTGSQIPQTNCNNSICNQQIDEKIFANKMPLFACEIEQKP